ncbi:organic cation transporter protein-like isoform X2 [Aethina tumida]|nr:organic cation transporter protein-like isoform X2 [Aethina tumida]
MPDEKKKKVEEEEEDIISKAIGEFGRWQLLHTFLLSLFNIPCTWHIFAPTFFSIKRNYWCSQPSEFSDVPVSVWLNCTQSSDSCLTIDLANVNRDDIYSCNLDELQMQPCHKWDFQGPGETIISEFDLLCDRKSLINLAEMTFLAGVAFGGLICGIMSDKFGRKKTLMFSVLIQTLVGTAIAFAPWFELYFILRAALGFISVSVVFSGFVLSIELVGGHWRTVAGISYLFPVSISYMTIAGVAYLIQDWRQLQLAISLPGFIFVVLWWVLPESPRWLLAMGRTHEVMRILEGAAKMNQRDLPQNLDKQLLPSTIDVNEPEPNVGVLDLFKTPSMCKRTMILFLIWFSVYLVYYGLTLNMQNIGGNLYINSALMGAVEIPAIAVSILILIKGGRRWPLALTMIVSGVCIFTIPIDMYASPNLQWLSTTLTLNSKLCISSSNAIMPVYTAELYPTTIRNIGVGAANVSAGIALILVPYLWELATFFPGLPMLLIALFGIVGGASVLFLPETGSAPLVDTIKGDEEVPTVRNSDPNETKRINNNC